MAIRDRLRRTFRSRKSGAEEAAVFDGYPPRRDDIEYYKPHEIPKSKYKGKVDPVHQERLEAYSFAQAFECTRRKTSIALSGTFSPGGTQALSAAPSRRSSWTSREPSSTGSAESNTTSATSTSSIDQQIAAVAVVPDTQSKLDKLDERDGDAGDAATQDDDGLSRFVTPTDKPFTAAAADDDDQDMPELCVEKTITQPRPRSSPRQAPFSAEELESAMARATLRPRRGTVIDTRHHAVP